MVGRWLTLQRAAVGDPAGALWGLVTARLLVRRVTRPFFQVRERIQRTANLEAYRNCRQLQLCILRQQNLIQNYLARCKTAEQLALFLHLHRVLGRLSARQRRALAGSIQEPCSELSGEA